MASLLTASGISKSFGERVLFNNISFTVDESSKIGFIGANGVGKTTLFRVIAGEEDFTGDLVKNSLLKIAYMEQAPPEDDNETAFDYTLSVFSRLLELETLLEQVRSAIERGDGDIDALVRRQESLNDEYLRGDGMVFRAKTRSMLLGLGFTAEELDYPLTKLSGGQKTRLGLARSLLGDANLLLLDEPTNHLDIDAISFLEDFLSACGKAYVVISHDRYFLDKVTTSTFELENASITAYKGSYSVFVQKKAEALEAAKKKYESTVAEIKRIEGIIEQQKRWGQERNFKIIDNKQKSVDRLEKDLEKPFEQTESISFRFPPSKRSGNDVLTARGLSKSYGRKLLFKDADFEIKRGERVFLLGPNGCGKSTLYNIIKGAVKPDAGSVTHGASLYEAYYDQSRSDMSGGKTVIDTLWDEYPKLVQTEIRNALGAFLFKGDDVFKTVDRLSGGEKARLALLTVMMSGANFLLLDEPTNHLDIDAREALEAAIEGYDGTVFIISHDRYLINKLSTKLLVFEDGTVKTYRTDYDGYTELKAKRSAPSPAAASRPESGSKSDYLRRKELQSSVRRLEAKVAKLEAAIADGEEKIAAFHDGINSAGSDFEKIMELSAALEAEEKLLDENMAEWETATEELERVRSEK